MKRNLASRLILLVLAVLFVANAFGGVLVSVNIAPPVLPVYTQPPCPGDGYIWTPGYWAYGDYGYYWVPGVWVLAPRPGFLWTPGYWGFAGGAYVWHAGYWGPRIGYYGGINYGFGYFGTGFVGGRWVGNSFHYNTAVTNVNVTNVRNTYVDKTVVVNRNTTVYHSYNGPGGAGGQASRSQLSAAKRPPMGPTPAQQQHAQAAHQSHIEGRGSSSHPVAPHPGGRPGGERRVR